MLKDYEKPSMEDSVLEELNAFVEQRRAEIQSNSPRSDWKS